MKQIKTDRLEMNELLFECYNIPRVFYGVDALFSLFENQDRVQGLIRFIAALFPLE